MIVVDEARLKQAVECALDSLGASSELDLLTEVADALRKHLLNRNTESLHIIYPSFEIQVDTHKRSCSIPLATKAKLIASAYYDGDFEGL